MRCKQGHALRVIEHTSPHPVSRRWGWVLAGALGRLACGPWAERGAGLGFGGRRRRLAPAAGCRVSGLASSDQPAGARVVVGRVPGGDGLILGPATCRPARSACLVLRSRVRRSGGGLRLDCGSPLSTACATPARRPGAERQCWVSLAAAVVVLQPRTLLHGARSGFEAGLRTKHSVLTRHGALQAL